MTGKQKCCSVLMQSLKVFCGDTEWSPLNVNTGSQTVKLLWLRGKDDISIMLSQHGGLAMYGGSSALSQILSLSSSSLH